MEELSLSLKNRLPMVDFLAEWSGFAGPETRPKAEALIQAYDDGQELDKTALAELVIELAKEVWPIRFALHRFFGEEGALIEWDMVEKAVRRSTAHLMERFKRSTRCRSLEEMFKHEDFDQAFRQEERDEIESVRHHLLESYWASHPSSLQPLIEEGRSLLSGYEERLEELKKIAEGWPSLLAEELLSKVKSLEDRIYFKGESVPLEIMDGELAYYREQKELPIEE
jgi:hypothetical protein